MEHYRSTLATTAAMVFGLVTAAHVLHPGNFEVQPRPARPVLAQADTAAETAWTDPTPALRSSVAPVDQVDAAALAPRLTMPLPAGMTMSPALPEILAAPATRHARTAATHPRRAVNRAARVRQVVFAQERTPSVQVAPPVARKTASGPLADLLWGLGLGRDG